MDVAIRAPCYSPLRYIQFQSHTRRLKKDDDNDDDDARLQKRRERGERSERRCDSVRRGETGGASGHQARAEWQPARESLRGESGRGVGHVLGLWPVPQYEPVLE